MTYTKSSPEWQRIMRENSWFSPHSMEYWNSKVYWGTLQPIGNHQWLFISSEDNYERTHTLFSIRLVKSDNTIDTIEWQTATTYEDAVWRLNEHSFVLGSC